MDSKEQMDFLRRNAYHVELHYRGFRIYLVGSDEGWWQVDDLGEKTSTFIKSASFPELKDVVNSVDAYWRLKETI